ncbi:MAG: Ig-like domain-containing protein, partial [Xanthomonadales bacterium]|nr:Ig-like domain-containing protein [Xanthomonadales bacterium]
FTTDAAPTVTSTVPANGALLQPPTGTITINFSEAVNFDTTANAANTSFDLECPAATPANFTVVTASPAASVVLDPDNTAIAGQTCTLTIRAAGITDADAGDPPDNLAADVLVMIEYDNPAMAADDAYSVTPHLLLSIGAASPQGGGVLVNDTLGGGDTITGFGPSGNCNLVVPNGSNAAASTAGGRVVLATDGSFSYGPPAGLVDNALPTPEDSFCYTLTGGSIGIVGLNIALTELVWFVDNNYLGANGASDGTQARPFTAIAGAYSVDTVNDTIHVASSATPYGNPGFALENGERLIGAGSGSDLETITGIVPVAGSSFPALGGSAPTLNCIGPCAVVTLGTNNTVRGLILASQLNGPAIAGVGFGTLTVAELRIDTIQGVALVLINGTLTGNFVDMDVTTGTGAGISLDTVGGTWSVTGNVSIGNVTGNGVRITNTPAGGSATFTGGLTINKPSAGAGVTFIANAAPINLGVVSVTTGAGPALTIDNSSGTVTTSGPGTVSATGGPALNISGSTLAINLSSASSTTSGTQGINLNNIGGTVNIGGGTILNPAGTAFLAQGTLGTFSYGGDITKNSGTSTGRLVDVGAGASGALTLSGSLSCQGACNGGGAFQAVRVNGRSGGTISFTGAKTLAPNPALTNTLVALTGNAGATINFSGTTLMGNSVVPTAGTAFSASGGGTLNLDGVFRADTNGGRAVDIDGMTLGGTMTDVMFSNGALGAGVPVIEITNSSAPSGLTFGQSLTFDHDDPGESGGGIRLQNNTGTYHFPRVITLNSTNTPALVASNGGTIDLGAITPGSMSNSSGVAIDVQNTIIGIDGINAVSVSSSGGANGILLNNTGTSGGLNVTGVGTTAGSGGTIQNITNNGIELRQTDFVSIRNLNLTNANTTDNCGTEAYDETGGENCRGAIYMNDVQHVLFDNIAINGTAEQGITGVDVTHLQLLNSSIVNAGNSIAESGILLRDLLGIQAEGNTNVISGTMVNNSAQIGVFIRNLKRTSGVLAQADRLEITNSTVTNSGDNTAGDNVTISVRDDPSNVGANFQTVVSGSSFTGVNGEISDGIQIDAGINAVSQLSISNTTFNNNNTAINITGANNSTTYFDVSNNPNINTDGGQGINVAVSGSASMIGTIANNVIDSFNANNPGFGIDAVVDATGSLVARIDNNIVTDFSIPL